MMPSGVVFVVVVVVAVVYAGHVHCVEREEPVRMGESRRPV